mmetsp:Transcript_20714/g.79431  ORF Transcript_20714/g.79431 Transcript_20714/m.79431 type:complete len:413 (+) Transcript_20714:1322-2560(+)
MRRRLACRQPSPCQYRRRRLLRHGEELVEDGRGAGGEPREEGEGARRRCEEEKLPQEGRRPGHVQDLRHVGGNGPRERAREGGGEEARAEVQQRQPVLQRLHRRSPLPTCLRVHLHGIGIGVSRGRGRGEEEVGGGGLLGGDEVDDCALGDESAAACGGQCAAELWQRFETAAAEGELCRESAADPPREKANGSEGKARGEESREPEVRRRPLHVCVAARRLRRPTELCSRDPLNTLLQSTLSHSLSFSLALSFYLTLCLCHRVRTLSLRFCISLRRCLCHSLPLVARRLLFARSPSRSLPLVVRTLARERVQGEEEEIDERAGGRSFVGVFPDRIPHLCREGHGRPRAPLPSHGEAAVERLEGRDSPRDECESPRAGVLSQSIGAGVTDSEREGESGGGALLPCSDLQLLK